MPSPRPSHHSHSHQGHGPVMYNSSSGGGYLSPQPYDDGFGGGYGGYGGGQPYVVSTPSSRSRRHHSSQPHYVSVDHDCIYIESIIFADLHYLISTIVIVAVAVVMEGTVRAMVIALTVIDHSERKFFVSLALGVTDHAVTAEASKVGACSATTIDIALDTWIHDQEWRLIVLADLCTRSRSSESLRHAVACFV